MSKESPHTESAESEAGIDLVDITMTSKHEFGKGFTPHHVRKAYVDAREIITELYHKYFHTMLYTIFIVFNSLIALSSLWIYLNAFIGLENGIAALQHLLPENVQWIASIFNLIYIDLEKRPYFWLCCLFFVYLSWCYSTNTQPIKKGFKTIVSYTSEKGRRFTLVLTIVQMFFIYSGLFAWYMKRISFDYFARVVVEDKPFLKITSMEGFLNFIYVTPVIVTLIMSFLIIREFHKTPELKKRFYEWEFELFASQSFSLKNKSSDIIIGWNKNNNKPIVITEMSRYLHSLIVGATGSGKTSTAILIRIVQDLIRLARGVKLGIIVLEPKGDLVKDVEKLAEKIGVDKSKIKVIDPTDKTSKIKMNPLAGPMDAAAAQWSGILDSLSGDQDPFFKGQQAEVSNNYVLLGKLRYGEDFGFIQHLQPMYADARFLADIAEEVRKWIDKNLLNENLTEEETFLLNKYNRICEYFENDVLDYKSDRDKEGRTTPRIYPSGKHAGKQIVENKKDKFITGAKKYVTDISMNSLLSNLLIAKGDDEILDIDKFLAEGGVLLINTALGELEELSIIFGQFVIRSIQSSVFRRPPNDVTKRIPIFLNIDEFPLYINESFVRLLTLGRSYLVGTLIAIQNLAQLRSVKEGYDQTIINNCSNKVVFGRGELTDNEYFSKHFGDDEVNEESSNESRTPFSMPNQSVGYRHNVQKTLKPRFTPTEIKEAPFKHFIAEIVDAEGNISKPVLSYGKFVNETSLIKKFYKIGDTELLTREHKPLNYLGNFNQLKYLVQKLDPVTSTKTDPATPEVDKAKEQNQQQTSHEVAQDVSQNVVQEIVPVVSHVEQPVSTSIVVNEPDKAQDQVYEVVDDIFIDHKEVVDHEAGDNDHVTWETAEAGSTNSFAEVSASTETVVHEDDLASLEVTEDSKSEASDTDARYDVSTASIPADFDKIIQTVQDNLKDVLPQGNVSDPVIANETTPVTDTSKRALDYVEEDFLNLVDFAATDRKPTHTRNDEMARNRVEKIMDSKDDL